MRVHAVPHHVALHVDHRRLLQPHGVAEVVLSRAAQELGRGDGLRKVQRAMVVVLQHRHQAIEPDAGNEDRADPVVELPPG